MKKLVLSLPDILLVDWEIDPNVYENLQQLLQPKVKKARIFVIFFNVPDPLAMSQRGQISNAHYIGISFTDRELFALVTPLIARASKQTEIRRSVEEAALEGGISGESLLQVFQFVDIGHKSGCLLVEDKKPFGIVFFRKGMIVYAATSRSSSKQAIFDLLSLETGWFRFVVDKEAKSENCKISTPTVLIEWAKELDETRKH
jgi:hypothetical protein